MTIMTTIPQYYVRKDSTNYVLVSFIFEREGNESIDQTPFEVSKANGANLDIGDDVSIGYMSGITFVPVFSGDIVEKSINETSSYVLESYGGRLNRADHFSVIHNGVSPESIAEDIIDNEVTTLNYASTATSGITLTEFVVKDETPAEAMGRLTKLLNWQIRTDNDKNFYFEPYGETVNSNVITIGTNAHLVTNWNYVPGTIINSLTFKGGSAVFNTSQTFTATASQTSFVVDNKINGTVLVTDNAVELLGGVDGSTASYDYTIDSDNKTITFEVGATVDHTIIVNYNYDVPIKINAKNDASITANGTFSRKITEENINTMSEARRRAGQILDTYSELSRTSSVLVNYDSSYTAGETVTIVDSFNDIDRQLVINKMTMSYPEGTKIIEVGTPKINQYLWQKGLDDRLRILEQKQDNADRVQQYRSFKESINIKQRDGRIKIRSVDKANSTLLNSTTNGWFGTNTITASGKQQVMDEDDRTTTIYGISNPNDIMYERFNFTTFIDTLASTATVNTTLEKVTF